MASRNFIISFEMLLIQPNENETTDYECWINGMEKVVFLK